MAENEVQLTVKVNSETGQLEVVDSKLKGLSESAKKTETAFGDLSKGSKELLSTLGLVATTAGIVKFFTDSVKAAEENIQAMKRLNTAFGDGAKGIGEWAQAVQKATRFSDDEAITSVERLSKATRTLSEAQKAAVLAMDISVSTGKDLSSVTEILFGLINGKNRAIVQARDAFGGLIEKTDSTQEAFNKLIEKYAGAAEKEKGLTEQTLKLKHEFEDLQKQLGQTFNPSLIKTVELLSDTTRWLQHVGVDLAFIASVASRPLDTKNLWNIAKEMHADLEKRKTEVEIEGAKKRNDVHTEETDDDKRNIQERIDARKAGEDKKIANAQLTALAQRKQALDTQKFEAELSAEIQKDKAMEAKMDKIKRQAALADTVENLRELSKHSGSAFEAYKAFAIAQTIISTHEGAQEAYTGMLKTKIPFVSQGLAIAAAAAAIGAGMSRVAAIQGQSRPTFHSGGQVPGSGDVPITAQGGEFVVNRRSASQARSLLEAVNSGRLPGGAGGGMTVNVVVNFQADKLSVDNAEAIIRALAMEVSRETSNAVKLAVGMSNLAERNSSLAV